MNILLVSAHDDPKSFVAAMNNTALSVLERADHKVAVSDLYAQQFNPVANVWDFTTNSGVHANYMFEQQRAVNTGSGFSPDITAEMEKVKEADLMIFHFPLWWGGPPAILKGWFERIFALGFAWGAENKFEKGLLRGKKALLVVSVGDPASYYSSKGIHKATVEQHLYPLIHNTLAFCGLDVLKPTVVYNLTASNQGELDLALTNYRGRLDKIEQANEYVFKQSKKENL